MILVYAHDPHEYSTIVKHKNRMFVYFNKGIMVVCSHGLKPK